MRSGINPQKGSFRKIRIPYQPRQDRCFTNNKTEQVSAASLLRYRCIFCCIFSSPYISKIKLHRTECLPEYLSWRGQSRPPADQIIFPAAARSLITKIFEHGSVLLSYTDFSYQMTLPLRPSSLNAPRQRESRLLFRLSPMQNMVPSGTV